MKINKKIIFAVIMLLVMLVVPNVAAKSKEKVKVYIFEAGGCPYCEAEVSYLKELKSYDKKFEIVMKELYVDHVDWQPGKDYALGKEVAEAFYEAGFTDASYQGTPFVVISNVYAAAAYSTDLESIIDEVYKKGDKDIVKCFEDGNDNCARKIKSFKLNIDYTFVVEILLIIGLGVLYFVKSNKDRNMILAQLSNSNREELKKETKISLPKLAIKKDKTKKEKK